MWTKAYIINFINLDKYLFFILHTFVWWSFKVLKVLKEVFFYAGIILSYTMAINKILGKQISPRNKLNIFELIFGFTKTLNNFIVDLDNALI